MTSTSSSRSRFTLLTTITVLTVVSRATDVIGGDKDEGLKQRFLQEAPPKWVEYARRSVELQGVVTIKGTTTINNAESDNRVEYKTNGRGKLVRIIVKETKNGKLERDKEEVYGFNSRYGFVLWRATPDRPWALAEFIERKAGTDLGVITRRIESYLACITGGVTLDNESLADVVRNPDFHISKCRAVRADNQEFVEVNFEYTTMDGKWKRHKSGKMLFDPSRYWCCHSGELRVTNEGFSTGTEQFRGPQSANKGDGPPLSRVWELDGEYASVKGEWSNRRKFRWEAQLTRPTRQPGDEEFTLSAFGLPEPPGVKWEKPTPRYVWFLAATGVFLASAVVFGYLARRRPTMATATT